MSDTKEHIVMFEGVSATVGGCDISSIAELSITASANSIPQITLLVDAGASGGVAQTYVDTVTLSTASGILEICREMVKKDSATLSLSITCKDLTTGGSETLKITGWLLTDVSMSPIQRSGTCMVSLTFQHPVCKANFGGIVPGLLSSPPKLDNITGGNPLDVYVAALHEYANAPREEPLAISVPGTADVTSIREALLSHLNKATSNFVKHVKWTGSGGLPAESYLGEWGDLLAKGISAYAIPGSGTSVLQAFMSYVMPECSISLGGDYTLDYLEAKPLDPWASASLSVNETDIISLSFPAHDPTPISGVKITMGVSEGETIDSFMPETKQSEDAGKPTEAYYVPASQLSADYLYGPVQIIQEPGWLSQMASYGKSKWSSQRSDASMVQKGSVNVAVGVQRGADPDLGGGGGAVVPAYSYGEAVMACAKAYYETMLMKDWAFTVNTRFMLSSGGTICPGKVLAVNAEEGEVMSGYVVAVEHVISVASKAAHTRIVCTHPRFGSLPDGISGAGNALYS